MTQTDEGAPGQAQCDVTIVLVAYRAAAVIQDCLPTVMAHLDDVSCEVVLVDNDSQDGTVEYVRRAFPEVRVAEMGTNAGFARANNEAIASSKARHVLLLNTDVQFEGEVVGDLVRYLDANPDVGAVTPAQVDGLGRALVPGHPFPRWWTPLEGTLREMCGSLTPLARRLANRRSERSAQIASDGEGDRGPVEADWISGACMMLSGPALRAIGGLDPRFFVFFEDVDWCVRCRRAGFRVQVLPGLRVVHLVGGGKRRSAGATKAYVESEFLYHRLHNPRGLWFVRGTLLVRQVAEFGVALVLSLVDKARRGEIAVRLGVLRGLVTPGWMPGGAAGPEPADNGVPAGG